MDLSAGDAAWILMSGALVLFMVPGLALFYGGMSRSKNMLNMLMMNMVCLGIVPVIWITVGYSLTSTGDSNGFIGSLDAAFMNGVDLNAEDGGAGLLFAFFALTFAVITPALISGAVADRMKFGAWCVFVALWSLLVFVPSFYWVYGPAGWIDEMGSIDFAGGTVVHVAAGAAALALALVLGPRRGWPKEPMPPHSLPFTMLGAGILWFGWFGFNAGSAFAADAIAAQAFANTFIAGAVAMLAWLLVEWRIDGHATSLGAASGIVAGLVGITPAAGFVGLWGAVAIGVLAGAICAGAVRLKFKFGYDDALDVVGVHMVGGLVGGIALGFFAAPTALGLTADDFPEGLISGGGAGLLIDQIVANVVVGAFAFIVTWVIAKGLDSVIGIRVSEEDEVKGLDLSEHSENAYII